jgi:hypothetical protein
MIIRFGAAVLFAGLSFASPSTAEIMLQESSFSLDLREGETQALDAVLQASTDLAPVFDEAVALLPAVDLPGPLAGLAPPEVQDESAQALQVAESLDGTSPTVSLADRDGSEDFTWLTADLAIASDMTTGSIGSGPATPVGDPSEPVTLLMANPSSEDASSVE